MVSPSGNYSVPGKKNNTYFRHVKIRKEFLAKK
jgi:hypothetical protein